MSQRSAGMLTLKAVWSSANLIHIKLKRTKTSSEQYLFCKASEDSQRFHTVYMHTLYLQALFLNSVLSFVSFVHLLPHSFLSSFMFTIPPAPLLWLLSQDKLCLPHHILEEKGLVKVSITVQALVDEASSKHSFLTWAAQTGGASIQPTRTTNTHWRDFTWRYSSPLQSLCILVSKVFLFFIWGSRKGT